MEYSNNYSKYIEDLKYEKSKTAFKNLVESTQEVKSNEIKVEDVFSQKSGESIKYEGSPDKKGVINTPYEDDFLLNKKSDKINNDLIPTNPNEYSSIQKIHDVKVSEKELSDLDFEVSDSVKSGDNLEYKEDYSEKNDNSLSDNVSDNKKDSSDISVVEDYSEKDGKATDIKNEYSKKDLSDISKELKYSEKDSSDISKSIDSTVKNYNDISTKESYSRKLDNEKDYNNIYVSKDSNDIVTENNYESKEANDLEFVKEFSDKKANNIINSEEFLSKESPQISNEQIYTSKSSNEIIASIKDEKKSNSKLSLKIDTDNKVGDNVKNYVIANPVKNEATDLVRQYIYFAYDPKDREAQQYAKYADRYNYYPRGSYDQINDVQSQSIDDIFNTVKDPSNWDSFGEALVNSIRVASDVLSAVNLVGPAYNIYVDGVTVNHLRQDLRVEDNFINLGESEKGSLAFGHSPRNRTFAFKYANYYNDGTPVDPDRDYDKDGAIGKIYVIPPYNELSGTNYVKGTSTNDNIAFTIPLQNNLEFEQISRAATYNNLSFFGRIGDIQQYSRTGSLEAINITTEYFVDLVPDGDNTSSNFKMSDLQNIEMKYRSLVLPGEHKSLYVDNEGDKDDIYVVHFTRPPVINIVLGKNDRDREGEITDGNTIISNESRIYNNLFTDVFTTYNKKNDSDEHPYNSKIRYKNFIVTNVSIDKSTKNYNYYVESDGNYLDTMGFKVTLTIIEVDENYLNSTPSFNNYYNTLSQRSAVGVI